MPKSLLFTPENDQKIVSLVSVHGKNWGLIQKELNLPERTTGQIRDRYMNTLDPSIKHGKFDEEEDKILLDCVQKFGHRWAEIEKLLPGRPANKIRLHYRNLLNRAERDLGRATATSSGGMDGMEIEEEGDENVGDDVPGMDDEEGSMTSANEMILLQQVANNVLPTSSTTATSDSTVSEETKKRGRGRPRKSEGSEPKHHHQHQQQQQQQSLLLPSINSNLNGIPSQQQQHPQISSTAQQLSQPQHQPSNVSLKVNSGTSPENIQAKVAVKLNNVSSYEDHNLHTIAAFLQKKINNITPQTNIGHLSSELSTFLRKLQEFGVTYIEPVSLLLHCGNQPGTTTANIAGACKEIQVAFDDFLEFFNPQTSMFRSVELLCTHCPPEMMTDQDKDVVAYFIYHHKKPHWFLSDIQKVVLIFYSFLPAKSASAASSSGTSTVDRNPSGHGTESSSQQQQEQSSSLKRKSDDVSDDNHITNNGSTQVNGTDESPSKFRKI